MGVRGKGRERQENAGPSPHEVCISLFGHRRHVCIHSLSLSLFRSHIALFTLHSSTMNAVYHEYKDKDQFLYMTYSGENVFGHSLCEA